MNLYRKPTKPQQQALLQLWERADRPPAPSFLQFRRQAYWSWETLMIPWCGMWIGIEPDGYTHS